MAHLSRCLWGAAFLSALAAPEARSALGWRYGEAAYSTTFNCNSGVIETNLDGRVGVVDDIPNQLPQVGQSFSTQVRTTQLGEAGGCGTLLRVTLLLPPGVQIAASAGNPTRCAYAAPGASDFVQFTAAQGCPQPPYAVGAGGLGYLIDSRVPGSADVPAWRMPTGSSFQFVVPVISTVPLDPAQPGSQMTAYLDGMTSFGTTRAEPTLRLFAAPAPLPDSIFQNGFQ